MEIEMITCSWITWSFFIWHDFSFLAAVVLRVWASVERTTFIP